MPRRPTKDSTVSADETSSRSRKASVGLSTSPKLRFREVNAHTLKDFIDLFESRGGPKNCWCMVWRTASSETRKGTGAARKAAMARRIRKDTPVGILGYVGQEPVAWCSVAPRDTFRDLGGEEAEHRDVIWSIVCFFLKRDYRQHGFFGQMLRAAVQQARRRGATVVEAYPVDPNSPSYRFMGFVPAFEKAGFVEVGQAGTRRHVMRLAVKASRAKRKPRAARP